MIFPRRRERGRNYRAQWGAPSRREVTFDYIINSQGFTPFPQSCLPFTVFRQQDTGTNPARRSDRASSSRTSATKVGDVAIIRLAPPLLSRRWRLMIRGDGSIRTGLTISEIPSKGTRGTCAFITVTLFRGTPLQFYLHCTSCATQLRLFIGSNYVGWPAVNSPVFGFGENVFVCSLLLDSFDR